MVRPASIVTFERCYLGAWIIGWIVTIMTWRESMAAMMDNPAIAQLGAGFAQGMTIGLLVIGSAITLALWYYVARRGSTVAKWIVVVFFALSLIGYLFGLATGSGGLGLVAAIGVATIVLRGIAVAMLFRPDAQAWFGELPAEPVA